MTIRVSVDRWQSVLNSAREISSLAALNAAALDADDAYPTLEFEALHRAGMLMAPFPVALAEQD
jgi:hypothetical protein